MNNFFKNKHASDQAPLYTNAGSAGTLIIIMGVFIVFYILLMPNNDITGLNTSNSSVISAPSSSNAVLAESHPGLLLAQKSNNFRLSNYYSVDDVLVKVVTQAQVIKQENPFIVSANIFSSREKTILFNVPDVSKYKNVLLSFNSDKHKGILYITLNGYDVSSLDLSSENSRPIDLTDYLQNGKNVLKFSVSKGFLSSNYYSISDLKITAYVTDMSKASASKSFTVPSDALDNFDSVSLKYIVKCFGGNDGKLTVSINGFNLSSSVPDCDNPRKIDFPVSQLSSGINYVSFSTDAGNYLIYDIQIVPTIKSVTLPSYFFKLTPQDYDLLRSGAAKVVLNLTFGDDKYKEGTVYINGYTNGFSTYSTHYSAVVDTNLLRPYDNVVKVVPKRDLEVDSLTVSIKRY